MSSLTRTEKVIVDFLRSRRRPVSPIEISRALDISYNTVKHYMPRLASKGIISKVLKGFYSLSATSNVIELVKEVLKKEDNVLLAYLFGSYAKRFVTPISDVDVAILTKRSGWKQIGRIWSNLAKALGVCEDKIDIVDLSKADIFLKYEILKDGVKLIDRGNYEEEIVRKIVHDYPKMDLLAHLTFEELMKLIDCDSFNERVLRSRIGEALACIKVLEEEILNRKIEDILASEVMRRAMERCIHVAIEAMLDICRHIVSVKKLGLPSKYDDLVKLVENGKYLPKNIADKLRDYVRLRNILIHRYAKIDHAELYEEIQQLARTVRKFAKHVHKLITS